MGSPDACCKQDRLGTGRRLLFIRVVGVTVLKNISVVMGRRLVVIYQDSARSVWIEIGQ